MKLHVDWLWLAIGIAFAWFVLPLILGAIAPKKD